MKPTSPCGSGVNSGRPRASDILAINAHVRWFMQYAAPRGIEDAARFADAVASDDPRADGVAKTIRDFSHHPRFDVEARVRQHTNEQIVWMLKGKMEFRIGSEQRVCGPGDVVVIPGGTEHEGWFPEDTEAIDFFAPPRDDFLVGGKPAYMKEG
jgi:mannose-6-phosphate isomerase-like protein (cupin superfamily)